ncbi:hypothetical protein B0H14DRAFT_3688553 [Mycena olivaceomarginata]|nr:hypothetical protein B0H14DRAFT_3688553 [Mycena olivaceomarginata]
MPVRAFFMALFSSLTRVCRASTRYGRHPALRPQASVCSDNHRWSDVVPPEAGLTFSVAWIRRGKTSPHFLPLSYQNWAEIPDPPILPPMRTIIVRKVLTITPLRRPRDFLFAEAAFFPDRALRGRTQTSSTLDGLDVYLRGSMLGKAHTTNRYYSCFQELDGDFAFDPCTSFAHMWMRNRKGEVTRDDISDEGFFEGFSGTTTSTSNFVTVENMMEDDSSTTWSALEAPNTPSYSRLLFCDAPSSKSRLRKPRPMPGPASPSNEWNDGYVPHALASFRYAHPAHAQDLVQAEPPKIRPRFGPAEKKRKKPPDGFDPASSVFRLVFHSPCHALIVYRRITLTAPYDPYIFLSPFLLFVVHFCPSIAVHPHARFFLYPRDAFNEVVSELGDLF